jgi:hypothetical protein
MIPYQLNQAKLRSCFYFHFWIVLIFMVGSEDVISEILLK